jgi:hypothetical protein
MVKNAPVICLLVMFAVSFNLPASDAQAQGIASQARKCQKFYAQWKTKPGHKAFAVSASTGATHQLCNAVWAAPSKAIAEREVLKRCPRCSVMDSQ